MVRGTNELWSAAWMIVAGLGACAPSSSGDGGPSVSIETLSGSIRVDWSAVPDASLYRVYWSTSLPLELASAPYVSLAEPPFVAANLSGTYHVAVQPILPSGPGPASPTVSVVCTPPSGSERLPGSLDGR